MSNFFKICCVKDPGGSAKENLRKMDQVNGHFVSATCPFSGESVELKVDSNQKQVKPNLRIKVPQPIRLKNHVAHDENFDTLHSRINEVTHFVSTFCFYFVSKNVKHNTLDFL